MYGSKKGKNALADVYRQKQSEVASAAFKQESLPNGLMIYLLKFSS